MKMAGIARKYMNIGRIIIYGTKYCRVLAGWRAVAAACKIATR